MLFVFGGMAVGSAQITIIGLVVLFTELFVFIFRALKIRDTELDILDHRHVLMLSAVVLLSIILVWSMSW